MEIPLELKNVCRLTAMNCVAKTADKTKNIYNTDTDVVKLFVVSSFFGFYHQNTRICNGQR